MARQIHWLSLCTLTAALLAACGKQEPAAKTPAPAKQQHGQSQPGKSQPGQSQPATAIDGKPATTSAGKPSPAQPEPTQPEPTQPAQNTKDPAKPQDQTAPKLEQTQASDDPRLTWPRDKDKVVASLTGEDVTLQKVLRHIDRHFPGYSNYLSTKVGHLELRSTRTADFIRQYADYAVLQREARSRGIKRPRILAKQKSAYDEQFVRYCQNYTRRTGNRPPDPGPSRRSFIQQFQKTNGLRIEIEGLLRALLPEELSQEEADRFYRDNAKQFNGVVDVTQIFVRNRDPETGALYTGRRKAQVEERVRTILKKLKKDGSNFAEIAAQYSHSERSRALRGQLRNLRRMDARMPSSICRAAWHLRRDQWTGPVESRYGLHFIKRGIYHSTSMVLRFDATNKNARDFILAHKMEDLLFSLRKKYELQLRY